MTYRQPNIPFLLLHEAATPSAVAAVAAAVEAVAAVDSRARY